MAKKTYPYVASAGPLIALVNHLRKSFPALLNADVLKKLGIAPNNESYVLGTVRFLGLIDKEGKKLEQGSKVFSIHEDEEFQKGLSALVKSAYSELFELHHDGAWNLETNSLISFFRQSADSSALVGTRQANTFKALAVLGGHQVSQIAGARPIGAKTAKVVKKPPAASKSPVVSKTTKETGLEVKSTLHEQGGREFQGSQNGFGLTVRIEVNLPSSADQETYDKIFQSIRKNLIERTDA